MLNESKTEVLPKIEVTIDGILIEVFTMEELTSTKIGAINVVVDKIGEQGAKLTIQVDDDVDVPESITKEDGYNSIDEVLDTSIDYTWSWEVAKGD